MDEQLKELMGESYHEGITANEVKDFFNKQLLSSGNYVNKEMADAEKRKLQNSLNEKDKALKAKMSDDEKRDLDNQATLKELEELKKELLENRMSSCKYKALGKTAEARLNANVKEDDKEFNDFLTDIISDDEEKTSRISNYINKIVKEAYEKGKSDITKEKMAAMGNFKTADSNGKTESLGAMLGKKDAEVKSTVNYFKR